MKYTKKFSLEIKMSEFYLHAIPKCSKIDIRKHLKNELYHAWHVIIDGEWGGTALCWQKQVYMSLFKDGYIEQTELSKKIYGEFN